MATTTSAKRMEDGNGNVNGNSDSVDFKNMDTDEQLRNALSKSTTLSPELFERIFLSPKNQISGELRKTFVRHTDHAMLEALGLTDSDLNRPTQRLLPSWASLSAYCPYRSNSVRHVFPLWPKSNADNHSGLERLWWHFCDSNHDL